MTKTRNILAPRHRWTDDQVEHLRLQPAPAQPVAWAFEHTDGRITYHSALDYLTAYRDTCVRMWPLYESPQKP